MSKRRPDFELTHDNWDEDLPTEEAGVFDLASNDELNKRVIKKAKRRVQDGPTKSVFAGFAGFGNSAANSNGRLFDFLANPVQNANSNISKTPVSSNIETASVTETTTVKPAIGDLALKTVGKSRLEYLQQLRKLNDDFVAWINSHFSKNPYLDLTPVFKDYAEHLKLIEEKYSEGSSSAKKLSICPPIVKPVEKATEISPPTLPSTNFTEVKTVEPVVNTVPVVTAVDSTDNKANEDEEETNYQPEVKVVDEENTKYKTRCKLFYMKDGSYVNKGIGTLYIRQAEKSSLLIRAETSLSNILLNISLNSSIPVKTADKGHVSLVCIPNPPLNTKGDDAKTAVTFLIKVKDSEAADELFKQLEEAKKS